MKFSYSKKRTHNTHHGVKPIKKSTSQGMAKKTILTRLILAIKPATKLSSSHNEKLPKLRQTIVDYLTSFRKGNNPKIKVKVRAEIIPFTNGVAFKLEFGESNENIFYDIHGNLDEVSKVFGFDLPAQFNTIQKDSEDINGTYMFFTGNILYLIKGYSAKYWGAKGIQRDLDTISRYVKNKLGIS
jgi:hypothetical protein